MWGNLISFLNNTWVSGIIIGIISTGIWTILSKFREKKEYKKRIELATNEFADTIESFIPEDKMPKSTVIHSLYNSIAKKHLVNTEDMPSYSSTIDYLILQVMKSNYLAYQIKINKSDQLHELKHEINFLETKTLVEDQLNMEIDTIRLRTKESITSILIPLTVVMIILFIDKFNFDDFFKELTNSSAIENIFLGIATSALSISIFSYVLTKDNKITLKSYFKKEYQNDKRD